MEKLIATMDAASHTTQVSFNCIGFADSRFDRSWVNYSLN